MVRRACIFVTGASGFIGGHATRALVRAGHEVRAMARSDRSAAKVEALGAEAVRCDLATVAAEHLDGCDAVVHAAAFVEEYGSRDQYWQANVVGTQRMLDAARSAGVRRFVHIGTEAVLFAGAPLVDVDERTPYPTRHRFLYSETKAEAERRVLAPNDEAMSTISLRPRMVWGPDDNTILPAIRRMAEAGSWVWLDGGQALTSTTHIDNLVHAIVLALDSDISGRALFVADDGVRSIRDFVTALATAVGLELPDRSVPGWVVRPLARLFEGAYRAVGARRTPPMSAIATAFLSTTVTVNTAAARRDLGYVPVISVDQGMRDLAAHHAAPR